MKQFQFNLSGHSVTGIGRSILKGNANIKKKKIETNQLI
jgi:hypothetical protein